MPALIVLGIGTAFYSNVEGWSSFDALYFSVITFTTVGYGDFSPHTVLGKAFTIIYIILGVGNLLGFIQTIASRSHEEPARFKLASPLAFARVQITGIGRARQQTQCRQARGRMTAPAS